MAEAEVVARFGSADAVAACWNSDQKSRRGAMRRNALVVGLVAAVTTALGVTQYASGKYSPPSPGTCTPASNHALPAWRNGNRCRTPVSPSPRRPQPTHGYR